MQNSPPSLSRFSFAFTPVTILLIVSSGRSTPIIPSTALTGSSLNCACNASSDWIFLTSYDRIYEGDIDCSGLEDLFRIFNVDHPEDYSEAVAQIMSTSPET